MPYVSLLAPKPIKRLPVLACGAWWAVALLCTPAWASPATTAPRFEVSADGAYVTDMQTKLVWSRCVEGMQWTGQTCDGTPQRVSHGQAIAVGSARAKAEGLRWRVPHTKEFQRLVNNIDNAPQKLAVLFPAAPLDWYWTASTSVDMSAVNQYDYKNIERGINAQNANRVAFLHGWAAHMQSGEARGDVVKRTKLPVRLVRAEN